jgi:hypothetical protein
MQVSGNPVGIDPGRRHPLQQRPIPRVAKCSWFQGPLLLHHAPAPGGRAGQQSVDHHRRRRERATRKPGLRCSGARCPLSAPAGCPGSVRGWERPCGTAQDQGRAIHSTRRATVRAESCRLDCQPKAISEKATLARVAPNTPRLKPIPPSCTRMKAGQMSRTASSLRCWTPPMRAARSSRCWPVIFAAAAGAPHPGSLISSRPIRT